MCVLPPPAGTGNQEQGFTAGMANATLPGLGALRKDVYHECLASSVLLMACSYPPHLAVGPCQRR